MRIRVLLWDADDETLELCTGLLEEKGYLVYACNCADRMQRVMPVIRPDVAVFHSGAPSCLEAMRWVRKALPEMPVLRLAAGGGYTRVFDEADPSERDSRDRLDVAIHSLLGK